MTQKNQPKKPSSPLGHIVFPKKGPVRKVIEQLPENKEGLEQAIVNRFAGALTHFYKRHIENIEKSDPWPDFEGYEGKDTIGIEIVELVNSRHNILRRTQEEYQAAILEQMGDSVNLFSGLHITLNDSYQMPPYPKVNSPEGQEIVTIFVENLVECADEIANYEVGRVFIREWQKEDGKPKIAIYGRRIAPREAKLPPQIGFLGTFPESLDKVRSLLAEVVQHKIDKSYTSYEKGHLILLVYEVGTISVDPGNSEAIHRAQNVLENNQHHFDEVWYIFPYAERNLGALHKVWPK